MFDTKVIASVLDQLESERGIPKARVLEAIEQALATAYKKEYGKRGQIVRAHFDMDASKAVFEQVKIVVDETRVRIPEDRGALDMDENEMEADEEERDEGDERVNFNPEHHILIEDARKIKKDVQLEDEIVFPLEPQDEYGRIAAQTAKQVIIQKIREAEKDSVLAEFSSKKGEIVSGTVQRIERGTIYIDLGRTTGVLSYEEQLPGERYRPGERLRAYLYAVDETPRGVFLRLSRSHPQFLMKLFEIEAPEVASGTVVIKAVAREAGSRSKIAVHSLDEHIDPVGSLVGQRGVRVSTVMSELGNEKIDIIEWSDDPARFIEDALSPARTLGVTINKAAQTAVIEVAPDQQSLAIGKGGQNVRLAAKLTGWKIDIQSASIPQGETVEHESSSVEKSKKIEPEKNMEAIATQDEKEETSL